MDRTPERRPARDTVAFAVASDDNRTPRRSSRVKKNPSVTPKRFTKFFTPRLRNAKQAVRTSRKALRDLSSARLNSRSESSQLLGLPIDEQNAPPTKKRKLSFASVTSLPSSPIKNNSRCPGPQESAHARIGGHSAEDVDADCFETTDDDDDEFSATKYNPPRVVPYRSLNTSAALLSRQAGGRKLFVEGTDSLLWQQETGNFYSSPDDIFDCDGLAPRPRSLPFCATSFKQGNMVAIGDEDGGVSIYSVSAESALAATQRMLMRIYPHDNAIMDMDISSDDALLVTASGDQTCRVVDLNEGRSTHTLIGHSGSIKRVQFQPGTGDNVVVTCSRDGSVCLWDLRTANPAESLDITELRREDASFVSQSRKVNPKVWIHDAHTSFDKFKLPKGKRQPVSISSRTDFAVTTCAFISDTRPHMLATASEHNAIIKLWDMRASYKQKYSRPVPVSATLEPEGHETLRPFGVTSIAMSTDGSRLYSLCRDHTVYAYSTSHLVLGSCPEMSSTSTRPPRPRTAGQGLGPLYGFRHPALRLGSFYDKLAVRPQTEDQSEMIATGTGDECAVVFPTNERYLNEAARRRPPPPVVSTFSSLRPRLPRTSSTLSISTPDVTADTEGSCPIYYHGSALVNGHKKEVTAVTWLTDGSLVTTADDYSVRAWHQDLDKARNLRLNTERDVRRNLSGWAAVTPGFDDDEDEEC